MNYYEVCPTCHGGTCQHRAGCDGCQHSDFMGFVPVDGPVYRPLDSSWPIDVSEAFDFLIESGWLVEVGEETA